MRQKGQKFGTDKVDIERLKNEALPMIKVSFKDDEKLNIDLSARVIDGVIKKTTQRWAELLYYRDKENNRKADPAEVAASVVEILTAKYKDKLSSVVFKCKGPPLDWQKRV